LQGREKGLHDGERKVMTESSEPMSRKDRTLRTKRHAEQLKDRNHEERRLAPGARCSEGRNERGSVVKSNRRKTV